MASFTPQQIEQFLQEFFDVVGARQYVGARYVPIFGRAGSDTVEWDDLAPYEPLTVVMHEGVSYVSRRYVPAGIQIADTAYWVQTYRFNAQVEQYRREVEQYGERIDGAYQAVEALRESVADDYVPFPDPDHYPKYGEDGQVLTTLANGTTKWDDPVTVDPEIAGPIIQDWLDDHPEATTTVQDGSITTAKLADGAVTDAKLAPGGVLATVTGLGDGLAALAASIDVSLSKAITKSVSANTLVYVDARLYEGATYTFTNGTDNGCSCSVEKVDGTRVTLASVLAGQSYTFTATEDYFKVGGWFNGGGTFQIVGSLGLEYIRDRLSDTERETAYLRETASHGLDYILDSDWEVGYISSDGSRIANDYYIRTTHGYRSYGTLAVTADAGYKFAVESYELNGTRVGRTDMVTTYVTDTDRIYFITMCEVTENVHHADTAISSHIQIAVTGQGALVRDDVQVESVGTLIGFTDAQNVNCSTAVGQYLDIAANVEQIRGWSWALVDVSDCEGLMLTAQGGSNPRTYCFLDADGYIVNKSPEAWLAQGAFVPIPNNAASCVINSINTVLEPCYKVMGDTAHSNLTDALDDAKAATDSYLWQLSNVLAYVGPQHYRDMRLTVKEPHGYNCWAFVVNVGGSLTCFYSVGSGHFDTRFGVYRKTSTDGIVWSVEREAYKLANTKVTVTGKGYDTNGDALLWFRIENEGACYFQCVRYDGNDLTLVSEVNVNWQFAHVADIINVGSKLLCFYNTYGDSREYGTLTSTDNGATWERTTIANGLAKTDCPTEIQGVYLGSDRVLAIGRKDYWGGTQYQFQLQSGDRGETWTTAYTNIGPILENTSTLIFDSTTQTIWLYWWDRSTHATNGYLWEMETTPTDVWNNPTNWPYASKVLLDTGTTDGGNANSTVFGTTNVIAYYTGNATDNGVYVMLREQ